MGLNKRLIGAGAVGSGAVTPSENFKVVAYTGDGNSTQSITGLGFKPDFVWIKTRTYAWSHTVMDSTRGINSILGSDGTSPESTYSSSWRGLYGQLDSFDSDGSVTSTVQANQDAGFSIVKYTGSGSAGTIGHGLSAKCDLVIIKTRDSVNNWIVQLPQLGDNARMLLDGTSGKSDDSTTAQAGNATVFGIGADNSVAKSSDNFIAYCFHSVDGFSKIGSYTGNGVSGGGPIIETGFEPAFVMIKNTNTSNYGWYMFDNKRNPGQEKRLILRADTSGAEYDGGYYLEFLSNGFRINTNSGPVNLNNGTFIYMAFAADPDTEAPTLADSFNVKTYTGNGGTQSITGLGFSPSFVWIKGRDLNFNHVIYDSTRGTGKYILPNTTGAEGTIANGLTSFDSDGFTVGSESGHNYNNSKFVAWTWKADDNEPTINDNGSINSLVSANANAGFSIVKYDGTQAAGATVGHGLSAAPNMIIVKRLDYAEDWVVYHSSLGNTKTLNLNTDDAEVTDAAFNNTTPSSTVFTLSNCASGSCINSNSGTYIAYCFHDVTSYQKFGSYAGNGTSQSINVGFKPDFVMLRKYTSGQDWMIFDSVRDGNPKRKRLEANNSDAEVDETTNINFTSTGFEFTSGYYNDSGQSSIYWAIKMNPTLYPVAGNMSFLVIAGGGGGCTNSIGGGGGAGGLRTSYGPTSGGGSSSESDITLAAGTYTITIGAGGVTQTNGGNSSIAASGLTTITSLGGGGGKDTYGNGLDGGSGGGSGHNSTTTSSGTANQGFGGSIGNAPTQPANGGGGGGASEAGGTDGAGYGGDGLAVEITGSSVTYAGGGGGSRNDSTVTPGGDGGGGGGATQGIPSRGIDGTANTGGGGGAGGGGTPTDGGVGGSGVVILRLLTSEYSSSVTGSPTVTTDGDFTIIKYTGSGTYVHS